MTLYEALQYEAEWWFLPSFTIPTLKEVDSYNENIVNGLAIDYGYDYTHEMSNDGMALFCLLVAEAIKE